MASWNGSVPRAHERPDPGREHPARRRPPVDDQGQGEVGGGDSAVGGGRKNVAQALLPVDQRITAKPEPRNRTNAKRLKVCGSAVVSSGTGRSACATTAHRRAES